MFNINETSIQSTNITDVEVVDQFSSAEMNDVSRFHVFEDMKYPSKSFDGVVIRDVAIKEFDKQFLNPKDKLAITLKQHPQTKRNSLYEFDFSTQQKWLRNYKMSIQTIAVDGIFNNKSLWFTMIRSNDAFIKVNVQKVNLSPNNFICNEEIFNLSSMTAEKERSASFEVFFSKTDSCNSDLTDFYFRIVTQKFVDISNITEGAGCIKISKTYFHDETTLIVQFDKYYASRNICFTGNITFKESSFRKEFKGRKLPIIVQAITKDFDKTIKQRISVKFVNIPFPSMINISAENVFNTSAVMKPDIITTIATEEYIYSCIEYNNREKVICISYQSQPKTVKALAKIKEILAHNNETNLTYGKDIFGSIVEIEKTSYRIISNYYWQSINEKYSASIFNASVVSRENLHEFQVKLNDLFNVTYFGLFEELNHKLIWPTEHQACRTKVGSDRVTSMTSCNRIKKYCPQAQSGNYWLSKAYADSLYGQVYCDMDTDEGGWMLITHHESRFMKPMGFGPFVTTYGTTDIFEVMKSNFTKSIYGYAGLANVLDICGKIEQVRFYCYTKDRGTTIHVATKRGFEGENFVKYLRGVKGSAPQMCPSSYIYPDDNSFLLSDCSKVGNHPANWGLYDAGFWTGYPTTNNRLIDQPFHYRNTHYYKVYGLACDSKVNNVQVTEYGIWKIFVRNKA